MKMNFLAIYGIPFYKWLCASGIPFQAAVLDNGSIDFAYDPEHHGAISALLREFHNDPDINDLRNRYLTRLKEEDMKRR